MNRRSILAFLLKFLEECFNFRSLKKLYFAKKHARKRKDWNDDEKNTFRESSALNFLRVIISISLNIYIYLYIYLLAKREEDGFVCKNIGCITVRFCLGFFYVCLRCLNMFLLFHLSDSIVFQVSFFHWFLQRYGLTFSLLLFLLKFWAGFLVTD